MVTDVLLKSKGFYKDKNYRKRKSGVSKFSWFWGCSEIFTIEKHHCGDYDEGETFYTTFRHNNIVVVIDSLDKLGMIIKLFGLTEYDDMKLNELEKRKNHIYTDIGYD